MLPVRLHKKRGNKYGARKVKLDGHTFDSQAEARRYGQLVTMARAGLITDLAVHPKFTIEINGKVICGVELDFSYRKAGSEQTIWEDVKGKDNAVSLVKRKLVEAAHNLTVNIVKPERAR